MLQYRFCKINFTWKVKIRAAIYYNGLLAYISSLSNVCLNVWICLIFRTCKIFLKHVRENCIMIMRVYLMFRYKQKPTCYKMLMTQILLVSKMKINEHFWLCQTNIVERKKKMMYLVLQYFGGKIPLYHINFINSSTPKTWNVCLVLWPLRTCSMFARTQLCLRTCHGCQREGTIKVLKVLKGIVNFCLTCSTALWWDKIRHFGIFFKNK